MNKSQDVRLELKEINDDYTFEGYGNTFNVIDQVRDVTMPGAFKASLDAHRTSGTMPKMLWQHDRTQPIGVWTHIEEDEKGLFMRGKLTKGVRAADEAYALLKDGAIDGLSIGYSVKEEHYDREKDINYLKEVNLRETSLVTFPCNETSLVVGVKTAEGTIDKRSLEHVLREAGLSRKEAKIAVKLIADGLDLPAEEEDKSDDSETLSQDDLKLILDSIKRK